MKILKKAILMLVFLLIPLQALYAETVKLTLDEALKLAMKANYDISMTEARLNELEALIGEARSGAFPQLSGTASYVRYLKKPDIFLNQQRITLGYNNTYSAGLSLTQPLYVAGKVMKALKAAKSETRSVSSRLKDVQEEISLQVKNVFYQVLLSDRMIDITKKTLKQFSDQLDSIKTRYDSGLESDYTLMRQEVQVSNVLPELSREEYGRVVLLNTLKVLLALPKEAELELVGELKYNGSVPPVKEGLVETALNKRQDLAASKAHIDTLRYNVGIQRGGYLPTVSVVSGLDWNGQTDDFLIGKDERFYAADVGVVLSWTLFDGLKTHYKIQQAKSGLKVASDEELKLKAQIVGEVSNAHAKFEEAVKREASQKKALELAQKTVDIAVQRFQAGLMGQLELNDTILSRDQADKLYAEAVYFCLESEAEMRRVLGGEK